MKIPFFGKKKKPQSEAVIDIGTLKEIDERNKSLRENPLQASSSAPGPAANDDMSFLGSLATAASSESSSSMPVASSSPSIDIEKLERLDRRIDRLIERFELIERKIERIERRVDLKY